jgi:hypothetical protein
VLKEISGDDQALNLAGPIEDAKRPRVPEQAFNRRAANEAEAAKICTASSMSKPSLSRKFGDRGFARDAPPVASCARRRDTPAVAASMPTAMSASLA